MENKKTCPYCGAEILADAKKCKHCGKWIEKQCPQCKEWVNGEAKKGRFCGYWFDPWQRRLQEKAEAERTQGVSQAEIEDAIEDRKEQKEAGCILNIECALSVALIGFFYGWSWWGYVLGIVVGYMLLGIQLFRVIYCIAVSIVWGMVGVALAPWILDESDLKMTSRLLTDNYSDYWWVGGIVLLISLIFHWPAMKAKFNF